MRATLKINLLKYLINYFAGNRFGQISFLCLRQLAFSQFINVNNRHSHVLMRVITLFDDTNLKIRKLITYSLILSRVCFSCEAEFVKLPNLTLTREEDPVGGLLFNINGRRSTSNPFMTQQLLDVQERISICSEYYYRILYSLPMATQ